ncbi:23S rRNA (uracil(1939)-C(5))-methyltransferase RlmD [Secundilactobacillus folii]|uniref:23S rRNA (Uracil(1939)-C(5))-methyltransferase RlmD n=1 Tax=Secundilactobacillus folii TaxID=2678357 RepID=A0A7X3C2F4_9LACO|nr:23S rRNA (uracil(1939)-C(5))-methyltransferase RlmD [Secundilactobacillus folii]MTV82800.1 23S rRNA (uracil(1939)-C(5))-methyltransferase RlmD [Secundilactobacillus folii]
MKTNQSQKQYQHSNNHRPRQQRDVKVEIGQRFPLTIKRMGINGEGIGYFKRKLVFVKGALPNEVIVAEVTDVKPRFLTAKMHRLKIPSPDRVKPRDSYAEEVGGFELEHLAYPAQLAFKRDVVLQSLEKYQPKGYRSYNLKPTIGMDNPYEYRNKAQFQVRRDESGHVIAGLYQERSHHLVDLATCSVQMPATMHVMRGIVALMEELDVSTYDEKHGTGLVRTVVVRVAAGTGEVQVVFVTTEAPFPQKNTLIKRLQAAFPEIVSIMQNINNEKTSLIWGEETRLLAGKPKIREVLNGLQFNLSARAFLQLNPYQTVRLYDEALKALDLSANETVIDAYSGVGTIGLSIAHAAKEVRGMDIIKDAVDDANENAKLNGISNVHYETGTAESVIPKWLAEGFKPDALIVDPPRTGLDDGLINAILDAKPKKFVYISCNPSTLAKDLVKLTQQYHVDYIQSVDMMPQTARCEAVVKFTRA